MVVLRITSAVVTWKSKCLIYLSVSGYKVWGTAGAAEGAKNEVLNYASDRVVERCCWIRDSSEQVF